MNFLNGALALGVLTALVPLVIHLFNRSRFKVIKWGATHLLESVLRKNRKQIQLEQWIILIIRCLIPALLALALARLVVMDWNSFLFFLLLPLAALIFLIMVAFTRKTRLLWGLLCIACLLGTALGALGLLPQWGKEKKLTAASGDVPASTVILLDDSLSMNAVDSFSKAQSFITGFLGNMHQQSETSIIQLGGTPVPIFEKPTSDYHALGSRTENLDAESDRISLLAGLDQSVSISAEGKNLKREIILLSDFRKQDWQNWDIIATQSLRERLLALPNNPVFTWIDLGKEAKKNLTVESLVLSSHTVGVDHPVGIRVTVRNFSEESFEGNLQVRLFADLNETAIDEAVLSVGPNASAQVGFTHRFKTAGPKVLHAEIQVADDLPEDNRRSAAVNVIEQINVLVVDGDPSQEWLRGETDFIKLALTPFEESVPKNTLPKLGQMKDLIQADIVSIDQIDTKKFLDEYSFVVLANLKKLTTKKAKEIEIFAENGGGVLICSGNRMDLDWYNEVWGPKGSSFLPMPISGTKGNPLNELSFTRISSSYFDHPALSMFNDPRNGSLAEAQIKRWILLDESTTRKDPSVTILARLTNSQPILTEKKFGKGVVMLWGTSIDTDWTNLPAKPSYLPFVQQLASYLSEKVLPPRTIDAGRTITHYVTEADQDSTFMLKLPDGTVRKLTPFERKDRYVLEFMDTRLPGIYEMKNENNIVAKFVVIPSLSESDLEKAQEEQIISTAESLSDQITHLDGTDGEGWKSYLKMDAERKFGRETWQILLLVVIGLIFAEIVLLRKFGRIAR